MTKFIFILFFFSIAVCFGQEKSKVIDYDIERFEKTVDRFPDLLDIEDWRFINRKAKWELKGKNFPAALDYLRKAKILAESLREDLLTAKSYHRLALFYKNLKNYHAADKSFLEAISFYGQVYPPTKEVRLDVGYLLHDWSGIFLDPNRINVNTFKKGTILLHQAYSLAILDSDIRSKKLKALVELRFGISLAEKASFLAQIIWLEAIEKEMGIFEDGSEPSFDLYAGLARAYRRVGAYSSSLKYIQKLENGLKNNKATEKVLLYLRVLAEFYSEISPKKDDDAINESIKLAKTLQNKDWLDRIYVDKMLKLLSDKNTVGALRYLSLSEKLSETEPYILDRSFYRTVAKAVIAEHEGKRAESDTWFKEANVLLTKEGKEWTSALFLYWWELKVALFQKRFRKLKNICQKYLRTAVLVNSVNSLPNIYIYLARAEYGLGNLEAAQNAVRSAIDLVENKRKTDSANVSTGIFESLHEAYKLDIEFQLIGNRKDVAFDTSEKLKGRWLNDKIAENPLNQTILIDPNLRKHIFDRALGILRNPKDEKLFEKLSALEKKALSVEGPNKTPEATSIGSKRTSTSLKSVSLDKKISVASYVEAGKNEMVAFVWNTNSGLEAKPLGLTKTEISAIVREVQSKIKKRIFFKQDGKRLYDKLIKPLNLDSKHLIIVPDKSLWKIPFQALSPDGKRYLIEDTKITYTPSVSILLHHLKNPKPDRKTFQAFSNATYKDLYLKFVDEEAKNLAGLYGVKPTTGATESQFRETSTKSDILHFSMHAEVNKDEPFNSFLGFKPAGKDDGRLTVDELLKMKLKKGNLAFLASCDTTNVFNGEGLVSLAWAMMAAGSSTVVSAQWEANDKSTARFTNSFYKNLRQGLSSSEAIQKASIEMINDKEANMSDPYYWAQFFLLGDYR